MKKIKKILNNPKIIFEYLASIGLFDCLSDKTFLKFKYKLAIGEELNLDNPQTFNEKLQWLKLYDRKPKYIKMVDKYEVKKYIAEKIGEDYIIPTLGVYDKWEDIDFEKLPNQFVIKCTHDSGGIVIVKDKTKLDIKNARKKINNSLKRNYFYNGREWPYKNVKPRIIIEEYMEDSNSDELKDYKLMCFNGKVKCSFVCNERFSKEGLKVTFFDNNWNVLPFERHYPKSKINIEKPKNFDKMIQLAELLSRDIPFVRIDFYEVGEKIYFGEITFFPGSGFEEFNPEEWDYKLGSWINLEQVKGE